MPITTSKIRYYRKRARLSQMELARQAETTQKTVSGLETNRVRRIDLPVIESIARVLDVRALKLFEEATE